MTQSRFSGKSGLAVDFYELSKISHIAVEAPLADVSSVMPQLEHFFFTRGEGKFSIEESVLGNEQRQAQPLATILQLNGQNWTQISGDIRGIRALPLGQSLSHKLKTRCLVLEVTDDMYQSHAFFEMGEVKEFFLAGMNVDVKNALEKLGLDIPDEFKDLDPDDIDQIDEAEYSFRLGGKQPREAEEIAIEKGAFLVAPHYCESVYGLEDVKPDELIGMDLVWYQPPT